MEHGEALRAPGRRGPLGALRALLLHDADGRSTHCLALLRDVTEQRRAERRRAAAHGVLSVMAGGRDLRDALPELLRIVVEELGWERGSLWLDGALEAAWPRGSVPERPGGDLEIPLDGGLLVLDGAGEPPGRSSARRSPSIWSASGLRSSGSTTRCTTRSPGCPTGCCSSTASTTRSRRQQREHAPLAVLFLDFDGFKAVNDRFGHTVGDEVLVEAAARRGPTLRAEDTVGRFGGDELVVLSEHVPGGRGQAAGIARADPRAPARADRGRGAGRGPVGEHRDRRRAGRGADARGAARAAPTPRCTAPRPAGRGATSSRSRSTFRPEPEQGENWAQSDPVQA